MLDFSDYQVSFDNQQKLSEICFNLWFLILEQKVTESNEADDYGHIIPEECSFISGYYLEKCGTVCKGQKFKIMAIRRHAYTEKVSFSRLLM